ncbi:hypothetical protein ACGFZP_26940 [Kitasatospora sp. NPDC048239]
MDAADAGLQRAPGQLNDVTGTVGLAVVGVLGLIADDLRIPVSSNP